MQLYQRKTYDTGEEELHIYYYDEPSLLLENLILDSHDEAIDVLVGLL